MFANDFSAVPSPADFPARIGSERPVRAFESTGRTAKEYMPAYETSTAADSDARYSGVKLSRADAPKNFNYPAERLMQAKERLGKLVDMARQARNQAQSHLDSSPKVSEGRAIAGRDPFPPGLCGLSDEIQHLVSILESELDQLASLF